MNRNEYNEVRHDLFCCYCKRQCKNVNSLKQHETRCKNNQNRIITTISSTTLEAAHNARRGVKSWNSGLTRDTDERLAAAGDKTSKKIKLLYDQGILTGRAKTKEKEELRRNKISITMKNNPKAGGLRQGSGRGHKGWYKNYFCDSTYELAYIIYNLDHNIKFERCKLEYDYIYNNKHHIYHPDFILPDGSLVEIKGYYTAQVDAKIKSVNDRDIKVLYEKDLKYAFDYINETYKVNKLEDLYEKPSDLIRDQNCLENRLSG